jgi:hypothetical protein
MQFTGAEVFGGELKHVATFFRKLSTRTKITTLLFAPYSHPAVVTSLANTTALSMFFA